MCMIGLCRSYLGAVFRDDVMYYVMSHTAATLCTRQDLCSCSCEYRTDDKVGPNYTVPTIKLVQIICKVAPPQNIGNDLFFMKTLKTMFYYFNEGRHAQE